MSLKTLFFVQPYVVRRHKLMASGAMTFRSESEALQAGAALANRRAGIVVMAQGYDPAKQMMTRPTVLRIHGKVPEGWSQQRIAA